MAHPTGKEHPKPAPPPPHPPKQTKIQKVPPRKHNPRNRHHHLDAPGIYDPKSQYHKNQGCSATASLPPKKKLKKDQISTFTKKQNSSDGCRSPDRAGLRRETGRRGNKDMINKMILMPCVVLSGLRQPDLVAAVQRLNPRLTTELKTYTYLRQGRNYDGQINARREYCPV